MKTLVVYYSFTHNNELLAKEIQSRLHCDAFRIEEVRRRTGVTILLDLVFGRKPKIRGCEIPIEKYDECIFIAPVWAGRIASPLKQFLAEKKRHINTYSFITVCGGYQGQRKKIFDALAKTVGQQPRDVVELWVNNLLPKEKKNTIKYTSGYRITDADLRAFSPFIGSFLWGLQTSHSVKVLD